MIMSSSSSSSKSMTSGFPFVFCLLIVEWFVGLLVKSYTWAFLRKITGVFQASKNKKNKYYESLTLYEIIECYTCTILS